MYSTPTASSNLLVRHTALLRRLSSHSAHSTHFPFSNRFLEVPISTSPEAIVKKYTISIISGCCVLAAGIAGLALLLNQPQVSESSVPEFVMPTKTVSTDSSSAPETSGSSAAVTTSPQTEAPPETPTVTAEPAALTAESPDIPEETIFSTSIQPDEITALSPRRFPSLLSRIPPFPPRLSRRKQPLKKSRPLPSLTPLSIPNPPSRNTHRTCLLPPATRTITYSLSSAGEASDIRAFMKELP